MQPKQPAFGPFGFFKKEEPKKEEPKAKDAPAADIHKSKTFGTEFPFVKAEIDFEGKVVKEVAARFKGNSTFKTAENGLRRPFKIDVNRYHDEQKIFGLGALTLGNNYFDPTRIREALGYTVFRAAKTPAPRTAFIRMHLTAPPKHEHVFLGVYNLIEPVDKSFLREHFGADQGMLLKPEKIQGLMYLGEKWAAYEEKYNPKREPTEEQKRRLIEFTKLVNLADEAAFRKQIADFLDVDAFLRFAAANSMIVNIDSFFGLGHNYYLYLHPKTNRFHFIPWDLDLAFGNFMLGTADQTEWTIAAPYLGKNRLTERLLAMKEHQETYRGHLKALAEGPASAKELDRLIATMEGTIKDAVAKEPKETPPPFAAMMGMNQPKPDLRKFTAKRAESVLAQLEGKSQGKTLTMNFGFGGDKGKGPPGGFMGFFLAKPAMEAIDADKDKKVTLAEWKAAIARFHKEAGGDEKTAIDEHAAVATLIRIWPQPQGFGKTALPKDFGPAKTLASSLLKHGADGKITLAQTLAAAERTHRQWDKDNDGTLSEREVGEAISSLFTPETVGKRPDDKK